MEIEFSKISPFLSNTPIVAILRYKSGLHVFHVMFNI